MCLLCTAWIEKDRATSASPSPQKLGEAILPQVEGLVTSGSTTIFNGFLDQKKYFKQKSVTIAAIYWDTMQMLHTTEQNIARLKMHINICIIYIYIYT